MTIENKSTTVRVTFDGMIYGDLKERAEKAGMTVTDAVFDAVADWLVKEWSRERQLEPTG